MFNLADAGEYDEYDTEPADAPSETSVAEQTAAEESIQAGYTLDLLDEIDYQERLAARGLTLVLRPDLGIAMEVPSAPGALSATSAAPATRPMVP